MKNNMAEIDAKTLEEVRASINKAWVLGSEHFRNIIVTQLNRRASSLPKGATGNLENMEMENHDVSIESVDIDDTILKTVAGIN